jgi:enoyl-CoA hydratase/carnithine racemase
VTKPVIAAVNSPAAGTGMTLALDADLVVATAHARFSDVHVQIGLVIAGGPMVIATSVPPSEVFRIAIGGVMTAQRTLELGVASELATDTDELRTMTKTYAQLIPAPRRPR